VELVVEPHGAVGEELVDRAGGRFEEEDARDLRRGPALAPQTFAQGGEHDGRTVAPSRDGVDGHQEGVDRGEEGVDGRPLDRAVLGLVGRVVPTVAGQRTFVLPAPAVVVCGGGLGAVELAGQLVGSGLIGRSGLVVVRPLVLDGGP
jgi:hypothetical protein